MSKRYNGGISLTIGSGTTALSIDTISAYNVDWQRETETVQKYDYSTYTVVKGDRFTARVETGYMSDTDMATLRNKLLGSSTFLFTCPEYPSGVDVTLTSLSQPLQSANIYGKYYRVAFSVAAVGLVNGGSL